MTDLPSTPREALEAAALLPCRECGAPVSIQVFNGKHIIEGATVWMCSAHPLLGGMCKNDAVYLTEDAWNTRAIPVGEPAPDPLTARLVEALQDSRLCVQAFLDMVNVIQRVQALPIPAILETAKHNCPIILQDIDAALAAAEGRG